MYNDRDLSCSGSGGWRAWGGDLVLALGWVPQFFSMWHVLGQEGSSWLLYSHGGSLGWDDWSSWGLMGHRSVQVAWALAQYER